jgi:hypothetical protein
MLSKTAEYALRVAVCLTQSPDKLASADELAEVTKVPRRYLHKVVQDLARGGIGSFTAGARRRIFDRHVAEKNRHSGRCQCRGAAGADTPMPAWADLTHETGPAASRARQGLRGNGKGLCPGDARPVAALHQRDSSALRGEMISAVNAVRLIHRYFPRSTFFYALTSSVAIGLLAEVIEASL